MPSDRTQDRNDITVLLHKVRVGDAHAASDLMPLIYQELHAVAARHMQRERPNHTLQPTVLVHEAFLQLAQEDAVDWQNRAHFFAIASRAMRRVLIDHARAAKAQKRPGGHLQVELHETVKVTERSIDVLALNEALDRLALLDARQAQVVEMRFFAGLSFEEIATILGVSLRTAKRDWTISRAWLHAELSGTPKQPA